MTKSFDNLILRVEQLLCRLEQIFQPATVVVDWDAIAWRWIGMHGKGSLLAVKHPHQVHLEDVQLVDAQKKEIVRNTRQFLQGLPANNVLLTGAKGTGKSSLIKALLTEFSDQGLRLIEVEKHDLVYLPEIVDLIRSRPEKFIIYCDDLTFEVNDIAYKALKVVLDGSIASVSENILVYATSNRKNLVPELMVDNLATTTEAGEIRPSDAIEEKAALVERFGLWLSFYAFDQNEYLVIAEHWLKIDGIAFDEAAKKAALQFAYTRGARSGRVAYQFARDYAGKLKLND